MRVRQMLQAGLLGVIIVPIEAVPAQPATPPAPVREGPGETSPYKTAQEHFLALKRVAKGGRQLTSAQLPDWSGVWTVDGAYANFDPSLTYKARRYGPLSPGNQKYYEQTLKNLEQNIEWDPLTFCLPAGAVRWTNLPRLKDFALTPKITYLLNELQSEVRRIYTDGRDHRPDDEAYPLWNGDSIGFWDGTGDSARLIVWTNYLRAGIFNRDGPRYSDKAELIEIYQKIDATHIATEVTVYDPVELTRPWKIHQRVVKGTNPDERIDTFSCSENNNVYIDGNEVKYRRAGDPGYLDPDVLTDPTKMLDLITPKAK